MDRIPVLSQIARAIRWLGRLALRCMLGALRPFRWAFFSSGYFRQVKEYVSRRLPPPDIVHANDLDTLPAAVDIARRAGARLVYDAQELYTGIHTLPKWYRLWLGFREKVLIRKADVRFAVNPRIAAVMEKRYHVAIDEVLLNCPPFVESPARTGAKTIHSTLGLDLGMPVYLFSGGLVKLRGIENTILSLHHLDDGILVLLGDGPLKPMLEEMIAAEGLKGRVRFVDFVDHTEVPDFISSATVGLLPYENVGINHYLCSPSKLFHYIMAELPIACSDFPFLRDIVIGNELGATFDPADPKSIADAIKRVSEDPEGYAKTKDNLRRAKRVYCWENEEQKFLRVYRSLSVPAARVAET